jgi:6-phosphofructokinase 2
MHDGGESDPEGAMQSITTVTMNPAVDVSTRVDRVSAEDKLRCEPPRRDPGGGGINVARVVRRLGGEARAVYAAGGSSGALLGTLLEAEDVPSDPVDVDGFTRENLFVSEEASGRQYRFLMPGAELGEAARERLVARALAGDPDYLVASGSLPPGVPTDFYAWLARAASDRGVRLILDSSGDALREGIEPGVFLLKPNLRELGHLAGREVKEDPEQETAALELVEDGRAEHVVVSLGRAGALLANADGTDRIAAPTVPIRSKVGAGDSAVGGIVHGLARGHDVATAARLGVAAGAATVMTPGTELCRAEDVERLFERVRGRREAA